MENKEWRFLDKSAWGRGEWDAEPDKVQWTDAATGLPCLIHRALTTGALCGYVGVAKGHPLYEKEYGYLDLEVHGGLSFSDFCAENHDEETGQGICHVPSPGEPDKVWWIGFDCSHSFDYSPLMPGLDWKKEGVYRNLEYAKNECANLAAQIAERAK